MSHATAHCCPGNHPFVTTTLIQAAPSTGAVTPSKTGPAAGLVIIVLAVVLLSWSFRVLGRTVGEMVAMFKLLANMAVTALLIVGALALLIVAVLTSMSKH